MSAPSPKPFALALVQLPPPVHGASLMNQRVVKAVPINEAFDLEVIPIQLSTSLLDLGTPAPRKLWVVLRFCARFLWAVARRRPNLIYFTLPPAGGAFYACLPLVALAKLVDAPLLYHFYGKGIRECSQRSLLYQRLIAWVLKGSKAIVLSPLLYADVEPFVRREDVYIVPTCTPPILAGAPDFEARRGRVPKIVFLSNLIETKGPLVLLDALAELAARGVAFEAAFAGGELDLDASRFQKEIRQRGLNGRVVYVGMVAGQAKSRFLAEADVFAFPTFYPFEAFPVVLLEAMSAGLPIVSTPEGGIPDFVRDGENGLLVPQRDHHALADALERLIDDRALREAMGRRNRDVFEQSYTLKHFEARMCNVWRDVAALRHADSIEKPEKGEDR